MNGCLERRNILNLLNLSSVLREEFADLGRCYPPRPSASMGNILLDLHKSSQPHSSIVKYTVYSTLYRELQLYREALFTKIIQCTN